MARKRKSTRRKSTKKRTQRGKGVMDVLRYVKNNKLISRGLGLIPHPAAQGVSTLAGLVGLGRRRRRVGTRKRTHTSKRHPHAHHHNVVAVPKRRSTRRRVMRGRGIFGDLGSGLGSLARGIGGGLFGNGRRRSTKNLIAV